METKSQMKNRKKLYKNVGLPVERKMKIIKKYDKKTNHNVIKKYFSCYNRRNS